MERRGLLTGHHLSIVQSYALEILLALDSARESKRQSEQFRYGIANALLASGNISVQQAYPELEEAVTVVSEDSPEAQAAYAAGDVMEDYSGVQWQSPSEGDVAEYERLITALQEAQNVTVTEGGGEWV